MYGYANEKTYKVAIALSNDEALYLIAKRYDAWDQCRAQLARQGISALGGVQLDDPDLDTADLEELLSEF